MFRITADHISVLTPALIGEDSLERAWLINRAAPKSDSDYEHAAEIAIYAYYRDRLGLTYSSGIENKLRDLKEAKF